ncbi:hypothetical protein ACGFY9_45195 [Streptomyces sp. NPDC048504]|uniref:hypothetical protein n=1 Tax=Streptomyces sp. NPDC048504 TaxID=3365559 RepID=UPI0037105949
MAATLIAVALYLFLPQRLLIPPCYVLPTLECVLLIPLAASSLLVLGTLIHELVSAEVKDGRAQLVASLQIWLTNIIVLGLAYWEPDRGGPVSRTQVPRESLPLTDFRFSQDENDDAVQEVSDGAGKTPGWVPMWRASPLW